MKNIIFSGCSFTWGQGLWHYGNFDDIVKPIQYEFDRDVIKDSHIQYMEKNRFSYIVSKYFGKSDIVKRVNGGSEDESLNFVKSCFKEFKNDNNMRWDYLQKDLNPFLYDYKDVTHIIYQTSILNRCEYTFDIDLKKYKDYRKHLVADDISSKNKYDFDDKRFLTTEKQTLRIGVGNYIVGEDEDFKLNLFLDSLIDSGISFDEFEKFHHINTKNLIKKELKFFEEKGIKVYILPWKNDILEVTKEDDWFQKRYIPIIHPNKYYKSIQDLMDGEDNMSIDSDSYFQETIYDMHPSLDCHKVLALSIIDKLKNE